MQGLPQRMLVGEGQQLACELLVAAQPQVGDDPLLQDLHPQLVQPDGGGLQPYPVRDPGQGGARPQGERLVQQPGGAAEVALLVGGAALGPQPFEARQVEVPLGNGEEVSGSACQQLPGVRGAAGLGEHLAQLGDVHLEGGGRGARGFRPPQLVDQAVHGDHLTGLHEQRGEQGARFRGGGSAGRQTHRPQYPETHRRAP